MNMVRDGLKKEETSLISPNSNGVLTSIDQGMETIHTDSGLHMI
jgi:hypothetical protein